MIEGHVLAAKEIVKKSMLPTRAGHVEDMTRQRGEQGVLLQGRGIEGWVLAGRRDEDCTSTLLVQRVPPQCVHVGRIEIGGGGTF